MEFNRRELLKYFGMGAVIAPVVQGVALAENHAMLIETPRIEIARPPRLVECDGREFLYGMEPLEVTMFARNVKTNKVMRMDCSAFMTSMAHSVSDVTPFPSAVREYSPLMRSCTFTVTGPVRMAQK